MPEESEQSIKNDTGGMFQGGPVTADWSFGVKEARRLYRAAQEAAQAEREAIEQAPTVAEWRRYNSPPWS